jgi:hypothetical protein
VCGHNLLDGIRVPVWSNPTLPEPTALAKLWMLVHQGGFFPLFGFPSPVVRAAYPVLPWIGVIAMGYVFANLWLLEPRQRRRALLRLSFAMILVFLALRIPNLYGDDLPWHPQETLFGSIGRFMNVQKYPPSLLYLLVTLAPCLLLLSYLEGRALTNPLARVLITYGRVPMFFYLFQWAWAHLCGMAVAVSHGMSRRAILSVSRRNVPRRAGPRVSQGACWMSTCAGSLARWCSTPLAGGMRQSKPAGRIWCCYGTCSEQIATHSRSSASAPSNSMTATGSSRRSPPGEAVAIRGRCRG